MLNLLFGKTTIYVIIGGIILSALGGLYYTQHYKPIKQLQKDVKELKYQLQLSNYQLDTCESNLTAQKLEGFINGIGENNEITDADFTNLHT